MKPQLIEIAKGSLKGLAGLICGASMIGLPTADGLYDSIESKQGKIAHNAINATLITAAAIACYNIGK